MQKAKSNLGVTKVIGKNPKAKILVVRSLT
jgi:hypothetical protein